MPEESIPQFPRRRLDADVFLGCMPRHVLAVDIKFQVMLASQARNEFLISVGFRPAQLVIEMN